MKIKSYARLKYAWTPTQFVFCLIARFPIRSELQFVLIYSLSVYILSFHLQSKKLAMYLAKKRGYFYVNG